MYHGVGDNYISVKQFEQHLLFYQKHFELFWASESIHLLNNQCRTTTGKPPLILTFDDGLHNNFSYVAPLLSKFDIKGTFYLVSDLLSGNEMLWNHEVRCRLTLLNTNELNSLHILLTKSTAQLSTPINRDKAIKAYVNIMKTWSQEEQLKLLSQLRQHTPTPAYTKEMHNEFIIMSLDNAKLLPSCIEIGSHTETHAILDTIPVEMAHNEICRSKVKLQEKTNKDITTFCYPNGNLTTNVINIVKEEYAVAVTVIKGFAKPGDNPMTLKRIPATPKLQDLAYRLLRPTS